MTHVENPCLAAMLERLREWTDMPTFAKLHDSYFRSERQHAEVEAYREKRGRLKRLRDEIVPVYNHLRAGGFMGEVRFSLNNDPPDAWLRLNGQEEVGIEVTIALSRAQFEGGRRLNRQGISPGHPHLRDGASQREFDEWASRPSRMIETSKLFDLTTRAVLDCLDGKDQARYEGLDLLVEVPVFRLPRERWLPVFEKLRGRAAGMPFRQIHLISSHELGHPFGCQLK